MGGDTPAIALDYFQTTWFCLMRLRLDPRSEDWWGLLRRIQRMWSTLAHDRNGPICRLCRGSRSDQHHISSVRGLAK